MFYQFEGKTYLLLDDNSEIPFKPYKKNYDNLTEIKKAAQTDSALNNALNYVTSQPILK
jgi:hypothetical protein